jgi:hypothetical protein
MGSFNCVWNLNWDNILGPLESGDHFDNVYKKNCNLLATSSKYTKTYKNTIMVDFLCCVIKKNRVIYLLNM